ncbi:MAG: GMC family oxidoreductase N-terminal domain-containing protein [Myxococcales bacterium]|nr:GMC family oxidoreductase N-terminal domain-containing protein [Myxococcales bacterium]
MSRANEDAADLVVIGSGAAGATAGRVLTGAGLDVVLLEEGASRGSTADLQNDMWSSFTQVWRDLGFQVANGRASPPILQGRCGGGTTATNGATIHRMPEKIWARWRDEFGLGDASRPTPVRAHLGHAGRGARTSASRRRQCSARTTR